MDYPPIYKPRMIYLIGIRPPNSEPPPGCSATMRIYQYFKSISIHDDDTLILVFRKILKENVLRVKQNKEAYPSLSSDQLSKKLFTRIHECLSIRFRFRSELYDVINPLNHERYQRSIFDKVKHSLWIIDLFKETIFLSTIEYKGSISFETIQSATPIISRFGYSGLCQQYLRLSLPLHPPLLPHSPPSLIPFTFVWLEAQHFEPDQRMFALVWPIFCHLNFVWRHILSFEYNLQTALVFANAIMRLASNTFTIVEYGVNSYDFHNSLFFPKDLPRWKPLHRTELMVGDVYVVICDCLQEAQLAAQLHAKYDYGQLSQLPYRPHYMLLSIRHVVLGYAVNPNLVKFTNPEPLLNGRICNVSQRAVQYVVWAMEGLRFSRKLNATLIRRLPVEIHNMVLAYGHIAAAQAGCVLGIGSNFN